MASKATSDDYKGCLSCSGDENSNETKLSKDERLVNILMNANESLRLRLAETNAKLDKKDVEMAEKKAKAKAKANEKIGLLEESLATLQRQYMAAMRDGEVKTNQLETDLRDTQDRLKKPDAEIKRLLADILKLEEEVEDLKQFNANVKTVKEQRIIVLTTENKTLTERLSVAQKEAEVRDLRMVDLEALVRDLRIQVGIVELD